MAYMLACFTTQFHLPQIETLFLQVGNNLSLIEFEVVTVSQQ